MDIGPQPGPDLVWMLGLEFTEETVADLTRATMDGWTDWVLIPGAPLRVSTAKIVPVTFVP